MRTNAGGRRAVLATYTPAKKVSLRCANKTPSETATGAVKSAPTKRGNASGRTAVWTAASLVKTLAQKAGMILARVATILADTRPMRNNCDATSCAAFTHGCACSSNSVVSLLLLSLLAERYSLSGV